MLKDSACERASCTCMNKAVEVNCTRNGNVIPLRTALQVPSSALNRAAMLARDALVELHSLEVFVVIYGRVGSEIDLCVLHSSHC